MIPMGPGPETATTSPGSISVSSNTAWTEHARGSQSAPAWRSRFSDRGKTIPCRTAQYLAKPPFIVLPWAARSTQKNGAPIWQYRHWPQSLAADGLILFVCRFDFSRTSAGRLSQRLSPQRHCWPTTHKSRLSGNKRARTSTRRPLAIAVIASLLRTAKTCEPNENGREPDEDGGCAQNCGHGTGEERSPGVP